MSPVTREPAPKRRTRRRTIVVLVGVLVVGLGLGTLLYLDRSARSTQTFTDAHEIVSIDLSADWQDTTAGDAGQISTEGDSGDGARAHRVPDVSAFRAFGDARAESRSWLDVTIDVPAIGISHREQHLAEVRRWGEDDDVTWAPPVEIADIGGYPALRSSGRTTDGSGDVFVITVMTTHEYLITFVGTTTLYREAGWDNLPTDPRREELARRVAQARIS